MSLNTVQKSFGWSAVGEISAKLISPIATIILARILTPSDFGILAICNMVLFFLDIIVDAGFSKYLIQREFKNQKELNQFTNVAFIATLATAIILWIIILIFKEPIAAFLGNPEYSCVIVVTSSQMILVAYICPMLALLRRDFQYKKLCLFRIIPAFAPLMVAVPLAYYTKSYWSLIIGSYIMYIMQTFIITRLCIWRPSLYWSFDKLKEMFGFSFWSLFEGLAHWLIFWIDTFILTRHFSSYYVGLYKNSSSIIMSLFLMVATTVVPVLFSTLSRIKNTSESFILILSIERLILYLLLPACCVIWYNKDLITLILLGNQWGQASIIIGLWAIIMTVSISIYSFPAEAFKAIGEPKFLFLYQCCYLIFLIPICQITSLYGFWEFVYGRFLCIIPQFLVFIIFSKTLLHWNMRPFFHNILKPCLICIPILLINIFFNYTDFSHNSFVQFGLNIIVYIITLYLLKNDIIQAFNLIRINRYQ